MTLSLVFAMIGLVITAIVAIREHANAIGARRTLLDRCRPLLSNAEIAHGGDGFPKLEGRNRGRFVRAELVPDTLTIRRLPQLWLKMTRLEARPYQPEFSVLIRPSGAEFYSLTSAHPIMLDPPPGLAAEIIAKGDTPASQYAIDALAPQLREMFRDPRMKEVAVTRRGLRLIWQTAEGERGNHLLLRQCRFENGEVDAATFSALLSALDDFSASLDNWDKAQAA